MTLSSAKPQFVTRKYVGTAQLVSGTFVVKTDTNSLPTGCKILRVKVRNLTGRTLTVAVPGPTALLLPSAVGSTSSGDLFNETKRYCAAPLSQFPVIKLEIPDLLARPLDSDSQAELFTVGSVITNSTDTVEIQYTVRYAL
jgi:hypothetical protein